MKKGYLRNVVNEAYVTGQPKSNIGSELYKLYTDLDPNARTKSGARVSEVLKMILDDLTETVDFHKRTADQEPWETLQSLFKEIEIGGTPFKRMTSQTNLKEEGIRTVDRPIKQKSRFGLKVGDVVYEEGDMMDECPFEGHVHATLLSIEPEGNGYEINIAGDDEGYTYTTDDIAEMGLNVEVVRFK
jgi:hypothetical protein